MRHEGFAKLDSDIEALSRRIDSRARELKELGRFSGSHEHAIGEIRMHERKLRDRVSAAIRQGNAWDTMKAELGRDYAALFDNFRRLEESIDTDFSAPNAARKHG